MSSLASIYALVLQVGADLERIDIQLEGALM